MFVPFASTAVGFVRRDIYLMAFGLGSWINAAASFACGYFSSTAAQSAAWLVMMIIFLILFYRLRLNVLNALYLTTFFALALYANIYLDTNTHGELYIGAIIGIADAILQSVVILMIVYPYSDIIYTSSHLQWYELNNDYMSLRRMFYLPEPLQLLENVRLVLRIHTLKDTLDTVDQVAMHRRVYEQNIQSSELVEQSFKRDAWM